MPNLRVTASICLMAVLPTVTGCYNTYQIAPDEFRRLQSVNALGEDGRLAEKISEDEMKGLITRGEADSIAVTSEAGEAVAVNRDTRLFVRSEGGRRYPITPFNFSMASSQLVASDRDTLIPLADLKSFEVDHLSTAKTVGMISVGVIGAVGLIAYIFASTDAKSFQ